MGHQSSFYITPKDKADLEQRLRQKTDFIILLDESSTAAPRVVDSLNFSEPDNPWLGKYLVRPEDLDKIVMHYVDTQGYWRLRDNDFPVIEFTGCYCDGKSLQEGRVYYVDKFWTPNEGWVEKSEAFRKWAKMVHTTIKKSLKRRPSKTYVEYIGADAQAWVDAGGQLVSGSQLVTW